MGEGRCYGCGTESKPDPGFATYGNDARNGTSLALTPSPSSGTRAALEPFGAGRPNPGPPARRRRRARRCPPCRPPGGGRWGSRRPGRRADRRASGTRTASAARRGSPGSRSALAGLLPIWVVGRPSPFFGGMPVSRIVVRSIRFVVGDAEVVERVQDRGELRLQVVLLELLVVGRCAAVPEVLLAERDDDLVDERVREARDLLPARGALLAGRSPGATPWRTRRPPSWCC